MWNRSSPARGHLSSRPRSTASPPSPPEKDGKRTTTRSGSRTSLCIDLQESGAINYREELAISPSESVGRLSPSIFVLCQGGRAAIWGQTELVGREKVPDFPLCAAKDIY